MRTGLIATRGPLADGLPISVDSIVDLDPTALGLEDIAPEEVAPEVSPPVPTVPEELAQAILKRLEPYLLKLKAAGCRFKVEPSIRQVSTILRSSHGKKTIQRLDIPHAVIYYQAPHGLPGPLPTGVEFRHVRLGAGR